MGPTDWVEGDRVDKFTSDGFNMCYWGKNTNWCCNIWYIKIATKTKPSKNHDVSVVSDESLLHGIFSVYHVAADIKVIIAFDSHTPLF